MFGRILVLALAVAGRVALSSVAGEGTERPRMYFADAVSGRPFSKDPAVVKFQGRYLLYYSLPPYEGKPTVGWSIGVATSLNLVDWTALSQDLIF